MKFLKRRSGWPVRRLFASAAREFGLDLGDQPGVLCQAEHEVDAVRLAPGHQVLARKAGVGAQQDARARPARADVRDDARHFLDRARRRVDVGAPQLGHQQMTAAEHVERQIAVAIVIAVEEPPFLLAVQRIVGRIEIENDLPRARARAPRGTDRRTGS